MPEPDRTEVPATTERVDAPAVRPRPIRSIRGGRTTLGLAALLVVGLGAVLMSMRPQASATPGASNAAALPASSLEPLASGGDVDVGPSTAPVPSMSTESNAPTPQIASEPSPTASPNPTVKPTKLPPNADPGPTDAPHPTWTPAATFTGLVALDDYCLANDGKEQVFVVITWDSPVPITEVSLWIDDQFKGVTWFASGGVVAYENRHSTTYSFEIGSQHTASARFKAGGEWVAGPIISAPITVQAGDPCPTA